MYSSILLFASSNTLAISGCIQLSNLTMPQVPCSNLNNSVVVRLNLRIPFDRFPTILSTTVAFLPQLTVALGIICKHCDAVTRRVPLRKGPSGYNSIGELPTWVHRGRKATIYSWPDALLPYVFTPGQEDWRIGESQVRLQFPTQPTPRVPPPAYHGLRG